MKTIAITIDEDSLRRMDRLAEKEGTSRSEVARTAIRRLVDEEERHRRETHEKEVFARHRRKLERQVRALIREQARP